MGKLRAAAEFEMPRVIGWVRAAILLVAAIPLLWLALEIARYGVEVPAQDDWEMAPLIVKAHTGQLTWADLFEQQQEARTVLPKIVFVLSAARGRWDVREQMMLSVAICALTAAGLYFLLRRTGLSLGATALCLWFSVLLMVSPAQFELWLLASGFPSFLPAFFIVAAWVILQTKWPVGAKFAGCATLATLSTFTLPHGMLSWFLTFPFYAVTARFKYWRSWLAGWMISAAVGAAIYFHGYQKPDYLPAFAPAVAPGDYLKFFLAFLGGEFAYASEKNAFGFAIAVGAVALLLFAGAAAWAMARWRDRAWIEQTLPWFVLGLYSLGSAFLATLGRVAFGPAYAIASRYVTFSLYLSVAVIVLGAVVLRDFSRRRPAGVLRNAVFALVALGILAAAGVYRVAAGRTHYFLQTMSARDRLGRSAVLFSRVLDTAKIIEPILYARPAIARERALALDDLRFLQPPLIRTTQVEALPHADAKRPAALGVCEKFAAVEGELMRASGWASLPEKKRPADAVVLAYQTAEQGWTIFAHSDEVVRRRDVSRRLRDENQLQAGWSATFPRALLPPGAQISAWAVDANIPRLYRLEWAAVE